MNQENGGFKKQRSGNEKQRKWESNNIPYMGIVTSCKHAEYLILAMKMRYSASINLNLPHGNSAGERDDKALRLGMPDFWDKPKLGT